MTLAILGWTLVIVGVVLPPMALFALKRWTAQTPWIATPALVIESSVANEGEEFAPRIRYEYDVGGQTFRGSVIRSGLVTYNWKAPAERLCQKYSAGASVTAYVDPKNPGNAVLETGGDARLIPLSFAAGIGLIVVGAALVARA